MLRRVAHPLREPLQAGLILLLKCERTPMQVVPVPAPCLPVPFRLEPGRRELPVLMLSPVPPEVPCQAPQVLQVLRPLPVLHQARCRVLVVFLVDQAAEACPNLNKGPPKMLS